MKEEDLLNKWANLVTCSKMASEFLKNNLNAFFQCHPQSRTAIEYKLQSKSYLNVTPIPSQKALEGIRGTFRLALFLGVGDGEALLKLKSIDSSDLLYYVVIEPSLDHLLKLFYEKDLTSLIRNPKCHWFVETDLKKSSYQFFDYFNQESHLMVIASVLKLDLIPRDEDRTLYGELEKSFYESASRRLNFLRADPEDAYMGFKNSLGNMSQLSDMLPFHALHDSFKGRPGIVIASGPSLRFSLPYLKKLKGEAILASCDSTLRLLLQEGIVPHLAGCLERVPDTIKFFRDLPPLPETWLVTHPLISPETLSVYPGPKSFLLRDDKLFSALMPEMPKYFLGPSVAHLLYWALHLLGCDPIALVGQDLAFDPFSKVVHVDGIYEEPIVSETWNTYEVLGNSGKKILSGSHFKQFIEIYEQIIWKSQKRCLNVIPKDYGACIHGSERSDPKDFFENDLGGEVEKVEKSIFHKKLFRQSALSKIPQELLKNKVQFLRDEIENGLLPSLLAWDDEISLFYHYHYSSPLKKEHRDGYENFLMKFEETDARLMNDYPETYRLIGDFVGTIKNNTSLKIGKLWRGNETSEKDIELLIPVLHSYVEAWIIWSSRISYSLNI